MKKIQNDKDPEAKWIRRDLRFQIGFCSRHGDAHPSSE
jgi:hypothetical protein